MSLDSDLREGLEGWQHREPPAGPDALQRLAAAAPVTLPDDYLTLLAFSNGGEGELGIKPGWFQLWPAEEVLELNRGYELAEFLPGFFGFGSNGGGELLALDYRNGPPYKVAMVPFIPMDQAEAVTIAETFAEFLRALGRPSRLTGTDTPGLSNEIDTDES
jgi:SMI1 / KNR4 family (SUKH-1)